MSADLRENVKEVLTQVTVAGDTMTLKQLVAAVAEPGDCLNCLQSPVRKAVTKLMDEGAITLGVVNDL